MGFGLDEPCLKLGQYLFARHGGQIIFFGRFIAVLRALAAVLAGANRCPRGRFLAFNAALVLGVLAWRLLRRHQAQLRAEANAASPGRSARPPRLRAGILHVQTVRNLFGHGGLPWVDTPNGWAVVVVSARAGFAVAELNRRMDQSAAPRGATMAMPSDHAERVVTGARRLPPLLGNRMIATVLLDRTVSPRELLPRDLKLEIEHLTREEAKAVASYLAFVVGQSHARRMDEADRRGWIGESRRHRSAPLEAPSWLWNCVVELFSVHEGAYLEHCRTYALRLAA